MPRSDHRRRPNVMWACDSASRACQLGSELSSALCSRPPAPPTVLRKESEGRSEEQHRGEGPWGLHSGGSAPKLMGVQALGVPLDLGGWRGLRGRAKTAVRRVQQGAQREERSPGPR
ncbi:unnamed protein product [Rangifer tarandus platyrhynchus]|uniref:Uncharacterized protein n=1 Tax=Rangifer tarandus platyrhynchus TaxID=3082113 RepID=A0AC60A6R9_RANTA